MLPKRTVCKCDVRGSVQPEVRSSRRGDLDNVCSETLFGSLKASDLETVAEREQEQADNEAERLKSSTLSNVSGDKPVDKGGTSGRARHHRPSRYGLVNF